MRTYQLPDGVRPLTIALEPCDPTSATAALRLHAPGVAAGQGRLNLVGIKPPATDGAAATPAPTPTPTPPPADPAPPELILTEDEAAEILAAIAPGCIMVVVEQ